MTPGDFKHTHARTDVSVEDRKKYLKKAQGSLDRVLNALK